jgi:N-acetyl-1-D-myo-inositol-2-amino-2-deoxy-alpha-D-glucopyranoside deacetylase
MKRLLTVFAHPDDETAFAGTLAHYAERGCQVSLICMTRGEAGEISEPGLAPPDDLGRVREEELRCSCAAVGVSALHLLGYNDSGMEGTPANDKSTALIRADPDEVLFKLVQLMRQIRPHVVITFEPRGWYGHPDHIATSRYTSRAYELSAMAESFPEAGPPWTPQRLFQAALLRSRIQPLAEYAREHGLDTSVFRAFSWNEPDPLADQISHVVDVADYLDIKEASMRCHRTQFGPAHPLRNLPRDVLLPVLGVEHFIQAQPAPAPNAKAEGDLFAGIPG